MLHVYLTETAIYTRQSHNTEIMDKPKRIVKPDRQ